MTWADLEAHAGNSGTRGEGGRIARGGGPETEAGVAAEAPASGGTGEAPAGGGTGGADPRGGADARGGEHSRGGGDSRGGAGSEEGTLDWFRSTIVGEWKGLRTTPWDEKGPESVTLEFREDGTWTGSCGRDCPVFHYGSWMETSDNYYRLTDVNEEPAASGRLSVSWPVGERTEGELREIRFESAQNQLFFDFVPSWLGELGPISFALERRR